MHACTIVQDKTPLAYRSSAGSSMADARFRAPFLEISSAPLVMLVPVCCPLCTLLAVPDHCRSLRVYNQGCFYAMRHLPGF